MMVKPTPIATPNMPTRVCRTRVETWVHAILSKRFVAMPSPGRRIFGDVPACVIDNGIDVRRQGRGNHGIVATGSTGHNGSGSGGVAVERRTGNRVRSRICGNVGGLLRRYNHIFHVDPRTVGQIGACRGQYGRVLPHVADDLDIAAASNPDTDRNALKLAVTHDLDTAAVFSR